MGGVPRHTTTTTTIPLARALTSSSSGWASCAALLVPRTRCASTLTHDTRKRTAIRLCGARLQLPLRSWLFDVPLIASGNSLSLRVGPRGPSWPRVGPGGASVRPRSGIPYEYVSTTGVDVRRLAGPGELEAWAGRYADRRPTADAWPRRSRLVGPTTLFTLPESGRARGSSRESHPTRARPGTDRRRARDDSRLPRRSSRRTSTAAPPAARRCPGYG
mmetsp:Transcript_17103/g.46257  ORF Transcript_17103/g.46257 Transcript_17103/m.46257 type:complete len:218 (+) Transcript_17103:567-1220(+)